MIGLGLMGLLSIWGVIASILLAYALYKKKEDDKEVKIKEIKNKNKNFLIEYYRGLLLFELGAQINGGDLDDFQEAYAALLIQRDSNYLEPIALNDGSTTSLDRIAIKYIHKNRNKL